MTLRVLSGQRTPGPGQTPCRLPARPLSLGDSPTVRGPSPGHDHTIRRRALDPWHPGSPGSLSLSSCVVGDNIDDDQAEEHSSIPEKDRQGLSDSPVSAKAQTFTSTESGAYAAYSATK